MRHDDFIDDSEYPDQRDIDEFGYGSPYDDDPLTIGYVGDNGDPFWTPRRIGIGVVVLIIVAALMLPFILQFLY